MLSETGQSEKKLCFVIGPIDDPGSDVRRHADWLLEGIIEPVFTEHFPDFAVVRADKIGEPGMITSQIITRLMDAPLVVADMSFHNANAFYELAIRHMVRLPTIHMIIRGSKIPFDVAPHRAIVFAREEHRDVVQAKRDLKSAVDEVMKSTFQVENPVTHARGKAELDQHASPAMQVVIDRLDSVDMRLRKLEEIQTAYERDLMVRALQSGGSSMSGSVGRGSSIGTPPGPSASTHMDWTSSGWQPRKPTDITGRSG